ncbi:MAG: hypothetical protein IT276_14735, partial [Ignavibacteriaceae bacterium]|nr:hypothetical protein [Ignavibacteriaceae bacterium]
VNYLSENVLDDSISLADRLNKNSVESLRITKQMINNISNLSVQEAVDYCVGLNTISRATKDFKIRIENFLNKDK